LGKNSFFIVKKSENANDKCEIESYVVFGSEFSKEIQTSSYKCKDRDLKFNGVALRNGMSFRCGTLEGNIECSVPGCFENIAGYYNLDIDGIKFQNLQGFKSYKYENTGIYKIEGNDVIADFKGANVHCNTDECYFFKGSLVYKPKSGLGIRKTGGLEIGLPGLKMFEIKPQVSDPTKTSSTGCFIVLEKGKLLPLERDDVYKEIGCIRPTKINILQGGDLDREFSGNIPVKITPPLGYNLIADIKEEKEHLVEVIKRQEEPAPVAGIKIGIEEVTVTPKCPEPKKNYGPSTSVVCMTNEEAIKFFSETIAELPKDVALGSIVFESSCPKDFVIDPLQGGCVPIKCSESKEFIPDYGCVPKEKIMPNEEVEIKEYDTQTCGVPAKLATDISKEEGQVLNEGEVEEIRCSPEKYSNGYYVAEKCIFDNSKGKYVWQVVKGAYFKDKDCGQIIKVPKVSYFRNEKAHNAYLAGKAGLKGKELEIEELRSRAISSILKEKKIKKRFEAILPVAPLDRKINQDITLGEAVEKFAKENSIPPALFLGLIKTESDFDESARSSKQARGLGQLTKIAVDELNRVNKNKQFNFDEVIKNPLVNLDASASYLALLAGNLDTNVCDSRVWAAYNSGLGNLNAACCGDKNCKCTKNYWSFKNNLPEETQKHVTRVYGFSRTFSVVSNLKGC